MIDIYMSSNLKKSFKFDHKIVNFEITEAEQKYNEIDLGLGKDSQIQMKTSSSVRNTLGSG